MYSSIRQVKTSVVTKTIRILLIESDLEYARLLRNMLPTGSGPYVLYQATNLDQALNTLANARFDVILMNPDIQGSRGLQSVSRISRQAPSTAIVILTDLTDESTALAIVREGAQDFLDKKQLNAKLLKRSIRYAIERQKAQSKLQDLTLLDRLTGLYNLEGFYLIGKKFLELSTRNHKESGMFFLDIVNLNEINKNFGFAEGDNVLQEVSRVLRATLRDADIVGRVGEDEFSALVSGVCKDNMKVVLGRFKHNLDAAQVESNRGFSYSLCFGFACFHPDAPKTIQDLLNSASKDRAAENQI